MGRPSRVELCHDARGLGDMTEVVRDPLRKSCSSVTAPRAGCSRWSSSICRSNVPDMSVSRLA